MFVLIATVLLLMIYQGECTMTAIAILYGDNSMVSYGNLTFTQENADTPVHITGVLTGLNASSAHVCLTKENFCIIFSCFRVFMFMNILYRMVNLIVLLRVFILILTVRHEILRLHTQFCFSLDTIHGPRTPIMANRHVGDLGNLTTDAKGTVDVHIQDSIIQLYNITQSIINRTIIVHLHRDDGGYGGFVDSHTTG
jgi:hypothetical protein